MCFKQNAAKLIRLDSPNNILVKNFSICNLKQWNYFLGRKLLGPAEPVSFYKSADKWFIKLKELTDPVWKHGFCTVAWPLVRHFINIISIYNYLKLYLNMVGHDFNKEPWYLELFQCVQNRMTVQGTPGCWNRKRLKDHFIDVFCRKPPAPRWTHSVLAANISEIHNSSQVRTSLTSCKSASWKIIAP